MTPYALPDPEHTATLHLDGKGLILGSCPVARGLFGLRHLSLEGLAIASLIPDLAVSHSSGSFNARYLAFLSQGQSCRRFEAQGILGRRFPVEVRMARLDEDAGPFFLLTLEAPPAAAARAIP